MFLSSSLFSYFSFFNIDILINNSVYINNIVFIFAFIFIDDCFNRYKSSDHRSMMMWEREVFVLCFFCCSCCCCYLAFSKLQSGQSMNQCFMLCVCRIYYLLIERWQQQQQYIYFIIFRSVFHIINRFIIPIYIEW